MMLKIRTKNMPESEQYLFNLKSEEFEENFISPIRQERSVVLTTTENQLKSFLLSELISLQIIIEHHDDLSVTNVEEKLKNIIHDSFIFSVTSVH